MLGSLREISGETCRRGDEGRSQSLCSTEAAQAARSAESKAVLRKGRQEGGSVKAKRSESMSEGAAVPETAKQALFIQTGNRDWIDRAIWTDRMLAALDNGVKGDKWFSLIDKVYRPQTLAAAWQQVKANQGAAGIDGQSIERFAAGAELVAGPLGASASLEQRSGRHAVARATPLTASQRVSR